MKPIIEYKSYRKYMQDFYEDRKQHSAFSWREFSRLAGFSSPNYMKVVCEGKSRLSKGGAKSSATAMGLEGYEATYFAHLVDFEDAKTETVRKEAYDAMLTLARENKVRIVEADAYQYFNSWVNPVIRELAPLMPGAKPLELARRCYPVVSAADVRYALDFLTTKGFLKKEGDSYTQTQKSITGDAEVMPMALRTMHRQMSRLATSAIDNCPVEERHITGITLGISPRNFERITKELDAFRQRLVAIAAEDNDYTQVYRLNMQLFPLTKKEDEV